MTKVSDVHIPPMCITNMYVDSKRKMEGTILMVLMIMFISENMRNSVSRL